MDRFGDTISFTVNKGNQSYKTLPGAIISLLVYAFILLYGVRKFDIMVNRLDTKQTLSIRQKAFPTDQY